MLKNLIWKTFVASHIAIFRASRGRLWKNWGHIRFLLLTTTGRKSGQPRTVPLAYITDGKGNAIVTASAGGSHKHPAWYTNLEANPAVTVELPGGRNIVTRAEIMPPPLRETMWTRLTADFPEYAGYQKEDVARDSNGDPAHRGKKRAQLK